MPSIDTGNLTNPAVLVVVLLALVQCILQEESITKPIDLAKFSEISELVDPVSHNTSIVHELFNGSSKNTIGDLDIFYIKSGSDSLRLEIKLVGVDLSFAEIMLFTFGEVT